jgi:hypothetical protein
MRYKMKMRINARLGSSNGPLSPGAPSPRSPKSPKSRAESFSKGKKANHRLAVDNSKERRDSGKEVKEQEMKDDKKESDHSNCQQMLRERLMKMGLKEKNKTEELKGTQQSRQIKNGV